MREYDRNPDDLFIHLPAELEGAANDVHAEYRRLAGIAADATVRALRAGRIGAAPELTDQEQYAICYVAGVRPRPGLMIGVQVQMSMPRCRIGWDGNRFVVEVQE